MALLYREDLFSSDDILEKVSTFFSLRVELSFELCDASLAHYYESEMGAPLKRAYLLFGDLMEREEIVNLKTRSLDFERKCSFEGKREINVDFGYVALEQVVLSTFKPFSHRIYLSHGVLVELVYTFAKKHYHPLPWSYPDYVCEEVKAFFESARELLTRKDRHSIVPC